MGTPLEYMPNWKPPARSYTTGVLANETSALVHMTDTPELFGGELRILGRSTSPTARSCAGTPGDSFPTDLKDGEVATQAAPELIAAATALQGAFAAGDATAAGEVMHTDVVLEDMSLRAQLIGRIEATAYLGRILDDVPYGRSSQLRHVVGGSDGGGFEWTAGASAGSLFGITALELDSEG